MAQPKTLAVVDQYLDCGATSIPKAKHPTREGVLPKRVFAQPNESIDPFTEVGGLHGNQDFHLWRDRKHHWAFRKMRPTATTFVA